MSRALRLGTFMLLAVVTATGLIAITRGANQPVVTLPPAEAKAAKPPATAATKPAADSPPIATTQSAVERALAAPAEFDFVDTPLPDFARSIADQHKINVLQDTKVLADAQVTGCTLFTIHISGVSLRSALHLALNKNDLAFVTLSENSILITTAEAAKTKTVTRVYVIRDLIERAASQDEFEKPAMDPPESIIVAITSQVSPRSWDANGGAGSINYINGALVVLQTEEIHLQIAKFLDDVRETRLEQSTPQASNAIGGNGPLADPALRVRKALETPVDFDFVNTPLSDIVDDVQTKLGVPIQLDSKSLADAGVTPDSTITFAIKQAPARAGLRQLLATLELDYVIEDEAVVITTADRAKLLVHPVVYPVGDLCGLFSEEGPGSPDYESLIETITSIIVPMSWDTNGGAGSIAPVPIANALVCDQTDEIQEQIAALLVQLRASGARYSPPTTADRNSMVVRIYTFLPGAPNAPHDARGSEQLITLIRQMIEPKSWRDGGASIGAAPDAIVVRQTSDVQARVENFLRIFGGTVYPPPRGRGLQMLTSFATSGKGTPKGATDPAATGQFSGLPLPADKKK